MDSSLHSLYIPSRHSNTLQTGQVFTQHQCCLFPKLSNHNLMMYKCIILHLLLIGCEPSFSLSLSHISDFSCEPSLSSFPFQVLKKLSLATKSEKGETLKSPRQETPTLSIPSPLTSLEVPKNWFENHTAFGRWIDTCKHRSLSYVDILDCNFFLFEDFEVVSSFIQTTPGKLLDSGSVIYPILV